MHRAPSSGISRFISAKGTLSATRAPALQQTLTRTRSTGMTLRKQYSDLQGKQMRGNSITRKRSLGTMTSACVGLTQMLRPPCAPACYSSSTWDRGEGFGTSLRVCSALLGVSVEEGLICSKTNDVVNTGFLRELLCLWLVHSPATITSHCNAMLCHTCLSVVRWLCTCPCV